MKKLLLGILLLTTLPLFGADVIVSGGVYPVWTSSKIKTDTLKSDNFNIAAIGLSGDFVIQYKITTYQVAYHSRATTTQLPNNQVKVYLREGTFKGWYCDPVQLDSVNTTADYRKRKTLTNTVAPLSWLQFYIVNYGTDSVKVDSFYFTARSK